MDDAQKKSIEHIIRSTRLNEETLTKFAAECDESVARLSEGSDASAALNERAQTLRQRAEELGAWAAEWEAWLKTIS
jgi:hypothetical protein